MPSPSSSSGSHHCPIPVCACQCDCYKGKGGDNPLVSGVLPSEGATGGGLGTPEISTNAYNNSFGTDTEYSNAGQGEDGGQYGLGMSMHGLPYLDYKDEIVIFNQGSTQHVCFIPESGETARARSKVSFDEEEDGDREYESPYFVQDVLTYSAEDNAYTLFQPDGTELTFDGDDGHLTDRKNPNGESTTFTYNEDQQLESVTDGSGDDARTYTYSWNGSNYLESVALQVGGVDVQQTSYTYTAHGELERITLSEREGSSWVAIENTYYKYQEAPHGLITFVVGPSAYKQITAVNDGSFPESPTDEDLAPYADTAYTYDDDRRVLTVKTHGGKYLDTFAYDVSTFAGSTPNVWMKKTTVTKSDDSVHTFYYNRSGSLMLQMVADGEDDIWYPVAQIFDDKARVIVKAVSAAISVVDEGEEALFARSETAGMNTLFEYDETSGNLASISLQEGAVPSDPPVTFTQVEYTYFASDPLHGNVVYGLATQTVYQNATESEAIDAATTYFTNTWYSESFQLSNLTTQLPVVDSVENGDGAVGSMGAGYDTWGFLAASSDAVGTVTAYGYDLKTGAVTEMVQDYGGGKKNLTTNYACDLLGRTVEELGPEHVISLNGVETTIRRATWTQYFDGHDAVRTILGYVNVDDDNSPSVVSPIRISIRDIVDPDLTGLDAGYRMNWEVGVAYSGTFPSGWIEFDRSSWVRWSTELYDAGGELIQTRVYHLIPSSGVGYAGTNYAVVNYAYDDLGRQFQITSPETTIQQTIFNAMGWVTETRVGTDVDPMTGNMVTVSLLEYDGGRGSGNGNLTTVTRPVDGDSENNQIQEFSYDWRNRQVQSSVNDGTRTVVTQQIYNNLDWVVEVDEYLTEVDPSNLLNQAQSLFDTRGRLYRTLRYAVDVSSEGEGTPFNPLTSNFYYDQNGQVLRSTPAGKVGFTVNLYDALGRTTAIYQAYGPEIYSGADATDLSASVVLSQTETDYDDAGNVITTTTRQRFDDDSTTAYGALNNPSTDPKARVSYVATYPDALGRTQATANYGTNHAESWTREPVAPTQSTTITSGDPRTTHYAYNLDNALTTLTVENATTEDQVTQWIYGVTVGLGSLLASNQLLYQKVYPDSGAVTYTYNLQGQPITLVDQLDTAHAYEYDLFGRLLSDTVTSFGDGVDDTVVKISRVYEARGMVTNIRSHDDEDAILNEVEFAFNSYSQLIAEYQAHDGEVDDEDTVQVGYTYEDGSANTNRRTGIVYPHVSTDTEPYSLTIAYTDDTADALSRSDQIAEGEDPICSYRYLGSSMIVGVKYDAASAVELTYENGGSPGDGGDKYTGLDRFGRLVETIWKIAGDPDQIRVNTRYGRDNVGNIIWQQNKEASDRSITSQDHFYTYDALSQVLDHKRGDLAGTFPDYTGITSPARQEDFDYDPIGNWNNYETHTGGSIDLNQARTHNTSNQITEIASSSSLVGYDAVGNMTSTPQPANWEEKWILSWDAWNRLTKVESSTPVTVAEYKYDGLGRRILKTTRPESTEENCHYYYSDQRQVLEERVGSETSMDRRYVWGLQNIDDLILRDFTEEDRLFVLRDQWNVAALTDDEGTVVERYSYSAFGMTQVLAEDYTTRSVSDYEWNITYGAYRWDQESGLYQVRFRYLHPALGRWLSRDPIEEDGGLNLYCYVQNSPMTGVDPLGLTDYALDSKTCTLTVKMSWSLKFTRSHFMLVLPTSPAWTEQQKQEWKKFAKRDIESYFSSLKYRCYSVTGCCKKKGAGIRVDLSYVDDGADFRVTVTSNERHRSSVGNGTASFDINDVHGHPHSASQPQKGGANKPERTSSGWIWQVTIDHEFGHMVGLDHPGHKLPSPPPPNSLEDYYADPESLMGVGMEMRKDDFQKAFCDRLNSIRKQNSPWTAK